MATIAQREAALYEDVWSLPKYHDYSPGLVAIPRFERLTGAKAPASVADFGCGAGVAGVALAERGYRVTLVDHTPAGLVPAAKALEFHERSLWRFPSCYVDYGFCVDVLEHLPTEMTSLTIHQMTCATKTLYLEVSTVPDVLGVMVGQTLHKTVQPFGWWLALCREIGQVTQAVDLMERAAYVIER
jgi:SAM-dependent methyltransferase